MGGLVAAAGVFVVLAIALVGAFGSKRNPPEQPQFAQQPGGNQPLVGPQVAVADRVNAPPPPPPAGLLQRPIPAGESAAPSSNAALASSPPPPPQLTSRAGEELPGEWRALSGGYCIKIPAAVQISGESLSKETEQNISAVLGKSPHDVMFNINVMATLHPDTKAMMLDQIRNGRGTGEFAGAKIIKVNGLDVVRTESHRTQPAALTGRPITLHGIGYYYCDDHVNISVRVYSQLPLDDPAQQSLHPYLDTLQPMPAGAIEQDAAAATAAATNRAEKLLEGGFQIRLSPELEITSDAIIRDRDGNPTHMVSGKTADGVQMELVVQRHASWKHVNQARGNAAARSEHPHPDYEHLAVEINGLLMERISKTELGSPHRRGHIEYLFREGPHRISMKVWSKLSPDDPSVLAVIESLESIERTMSED